MLDIVLQIVILYMYNIMEFSVSMDCRFSLDRQDTSCELNHSSDILLYKTNGEVILYSNNTDTHIYQCYTRY